MLESAAKFVFDLILENEEVKKFPRDFVTASMKWVRSWFLTDDDPQTAAVLQAPQSSAAEKEAAIRKKTETLLENPDFRRELEERMRAVGSDPAALERQGLEQRLALLIQKRFAVQRGYDLEADAVRRFAYEQQLAELNGDIAKLKNQLGV